MKDAVPGALLLDFGTELPQPRSPVWNVGQRVAAPEEAMVSPSPEAYTPNTSPSGSFPKLAPMPSAADP
jgi:hypothetical protein